MSHRSFSAFLIVSFLLLSSAPSGSSTVVEILTDRPPQSLRGQSIDLDDEWSSARLLAHFGETDLAYRVLRTRSAGESADDKTGRFEARLLTEMGLVRRADSVLAIQSYPRDERPFYELCLQRSRLNLMAGELDRALGFLAMIDTLSLPMFDPYKDFVALDCLVQAERFEEARTLAEKRVALGVPTPLSPRFEELLLDAYVGAENLDRALQFIDVVKGQRAQSAGTASVLIREVEILFAMGDSAQAVDRAVALLRDRRTRRHSASIAQSLLEKAGLDGLSDKTLLELCGALISGGNLTGAGRVTTILSARPLEGAQADELAVLAADLYYKKKRYNKSYALIRDEFEDAGLERRATLLRARIYRKTGQTLRAAEEYVVFAKKYPYDAKASEALLVASSLYKSADDRARSLEMLEVIAEIYPSSRHGRTAVRRMADYYIGSNDYTRAIAVLSLAVERSRRRNEELLYYLADTYRRMGDDAMAGEVTGELRELDPMSFYLGADVDATFAQPIVGSSGRAELYGDRGLLTFLKRVFRERAQACAHVRSTLDALPEPEGELVESSTHLKRARRFLEMGFRDWGETELRAIESHFKLPPRYWFELGVLYDDFAMHWRSVRAFQRVYYSISRDERQAVEWDFNLLAHPVPYPALIIENSFRNGVPPHLVYAMMRQESRFDLNAVSSAGAMGLMQLMPSTGDHVAGRLGFPQGRYDRLFVPEINLTFGIWYAAHLLSRTDGDLLMMLSAYNAGLGNARRWFRSGDGSGAVVRVDGIDYGETRDYVKRIVESARVYHALYFYADTAGRDPAR
jgi:soluble lytic murein transglycosylase